MLYNIKKINNFCILTKYVNIKMSEEEESGGYTFYGIAGAKNIFHWPHCETDRFYRQSLSMTSERYFRGEQMNFDECRNAYMKPKTPAAIDLLDHLHKYADY